MPSSHLILCRPLLLLPAIPPSVRVFSNESTLHVRWPKYWSFSFSIIPSKEIPGYVYVLCMYIYARIYTVCTCDCTYMYAVCIYTCIYILSLYVCVWLHICKYVVCVYIHMHYILYVYMIAYVYMLCVYTCVYIYCVYICIYDYICIYVVYKYTHYTHTELWKTKCLISQWLW